MVLTDDISGHVLASVAEVAHALAESCRPKALERLEASRPKTIAEWQAKQEDGR